jgi:hypothetical protein
MPSLPDEVRLLWGPGFPGLLLQVCRRCRLPVAVYLCHRFPKRSSLVLPQAGFSPLVRPCLWLKLQQQVRWLPPGPLPVPRSFQLPAVVFLLGIFLGKHPFSFFGPSDRFFFHGVHIGPTSNGDIKVATRSAPYWWKA